MCAIVGSLIHPLTAVRILASSVVALFAVTLSIDRAAACHRDRGGVIRLITVPVSYERLVQRSFEKVRQAADGMPAVLIRQLDALGKVMAVAPRLRSRVLLDQAAMIQRAGQRSVPEPADQADITARYETLLALSAQSAPAQPEPL
jgi:uncharacterized membrane protein